MAANHRLMPSDVIYILQSQDGDGVVAQRLGVSRQAVNNVRTGKSYRRVAPQLPRREGPVVARDSTVMCTACDFWNGRGCAFGFPEPLKDLRFAGECSMYDLGRSGAGVWDE